MAKLASTTAVLAAVLGFLLALSVLPRAAQATALTYKVGSKEKACFYVWNDRPNKKVGFYFAVRSDRQRGYTHQLIIAQYRYNKVAHLTLISTSLTPTENPFCKDRKRNKATMCSLRVWRASTRFASPMPCLRGQTSCLISRLV